MATVLHSHSRSISIAACTSRRFHVSPLFGSPSRLSKPFLTSEAPPSRLQSDQPAPRRGYRLILLYSAQQSGAAVLSSIDDAAEQLTVELPTEEAQASLRFEVVPFGKGRAVVVADVLPGSSAEAAGIQRGQRLAALSDPIRAEETWPLNERASLRYVRDAVRMRRSPFIRFVLFRESVVVDAASSRNDSSSSSSSDGADAMQQPLINAAIDGLDELVTDDEATRDQDGQTLTIGARLAQKYEEKLPETTAVDRRMKRRKEYMEQVSQRNDAGFFAGLALLFVLPAFAILLWAATSGVLDRLAAGWSGGY